MRFSAIKDWGVATRSMALLLLVTSLAGSVLGRQAGLGLDLLDYRLEAIKDGQWWRLATYVWVESEPLGLLISLVVLVLFGRFFEQAWGSAAFVRFYMLCAVGAGLLAIPLAAFLDWAMPFAELGYSQGPGPVFGALLVAMALERPQAKILLGFVLPMSVSSAVLLLLAFQLVAAIQTGASGLGITLGGMACGALLITGYWRPKRWPQLLGLCLGHLSVWRHRLGMGKATIGMGKAAKRRQGQNQKRRASASHLHVVRPEDSDSQETLH